MSRLDPDQQAVVDWTPAEGDLVVPASAGSGKTTTACALVVNLTRQANIPSSSIVVTTFTRKAGEEIKDRLLDLLPTEDVASLRVGTFHSLGLRALREADEGGRWDPKARCADVSDGPDRAKRYRDLSGEGFGSLLPSLSLILRAVCHYGGIGSGKGKIPGFRNKRKDIRDLLLAVEGVKARVLDPESGEFYAELQAAEARLVRPGTEGASLEYELERRDAGVFPYVWRSSVQPPIPAVLTHSECGLAWAWAVYRAYLHAFDGWDFGDVIHQWDAALRAGKAPGATVVVIDEAQDTDPNQIRVAQSLVGSTGRIVYLGDLTQALFAFRGADYRIFAGMAERAAVRPLRYNYRSGSEIVALANRVVERARECLGLPEALARNDAVAARAPFLGVVELMVAEEGEVSLFRDHEQQGSQPSLFLHPYNDGVLGYELGSMAAGKGARVLGGKSMFAQREMGWYLDHAIVALGGWAGWDEGEALERILRDSDIPTWDLQKALTEGRGDAVEASRLLAAWDNGHEGLKALARILGALRGQPGQAGGWDVRVVPEYGGSAGGSGTERARLAAAARGVAGRFKTPQTFLKASAWRLKAARATYGSRALGTVHSAKGGEAHTVYLHAGASSTRAERVEDLEDAEWFRWYVGITRARDRLVLWRMAGEEWAPQVEDDEVLRELAEEEVEEALMPEVSA